MTFENIIILEKERESMNLIKKSRNKRGSREEAEEGEIYWGTK
jgi:hypothetical protein